MAAPRVINVNPGVKAVATCLSLLSQGLAAGMSLVKVGNLAEFGFTAEAKVQPRWASDCDIDGHDDAYDPFQDDIEETPGDQTPSVTVVLRFGAKLDQEQKERIAQIAYHHCRRQAGVQPSSPNTFQPWEETDRRQDEVRWRETTWDDGTIERRVAFCWDIKEELR